LSLQANFAPTPGAWAVTVHDQSVATGGRADSHNWFIKPGQEFNQEELQAVLGHEIGHALSLSDDYLEPGYPEGLRRNDNANTIDLENHYSVMTERYAMTTSTGLQPVDRLQLVNSICGAGN